ncbi:MAG: hypothetical protein K6G55_08170 [Selenomonadaceae bacterium]|nr:hypothetical protein [Selenomonadaceae bacterium]
MFDLKKFSVIVIGVVLSIFIGTGLMIFVYSIPNDKAIKNVREAIPLYEREGTYPSWGLAEHTKLDNFTDAIMLLEVVHPQSGSVIESALLNPRYGMTHDEEPVEALKSVLRGETSTLTELNYPRYWHGYLLILKPMLTATSVNHVRMLMAYVDFILFVVVLLLFRNELGTKFAVAFAAAVMVLNLVSLSMSFQFSSIFVVTMIALIIMLTKNNLMFDGDLYPYFFAAIGIIIAFTDFLTYPIFSVAMMLTVWYVLNRRKLLSEKLSVVLKFMTSLLISWGIGYVGMWSGKWIAAQILTGENVLMNAVHQVSVYTQVSNDLTQVGWQITSFGAIQRNIAVVGHGTIRIFIFAAILTFIFMLIKRRREILFTARKILPYVFPAALPFIWYAVAAGHSSIHAFFTYRSLAATIFALSCLAIDLFAREDF